MQKKQKKSYKKIGIILSFLVFILAFNSCTYYESPNNPSTAQATVRHFTIWNFDWQPVEWGHWFCRINMPEITMGVLNFGTVLVHFRDHNNNWVLLPYSTTLQNQFGQTFTEEIWSGFALGTIDIDCVRTNPFNLTPISPLEIRVTVMRF